MTLSSPTDSHRDQTDVPISEQTVQQSLARERPQDRHVAYVVEAGANVRARQVGGRHVGATGPGLALGRGAGGVGFAVGVPKCRYHVTVL